MSPLDLVTDVLAVHRLTRLVTEDVITQELRDGVIEWAYKKSGYRPVLDGRTWEAIVEDDSDPPKLAVLVTCRWCASIWLAGGVVAARLALGRTVSPLLRVLALSSAATLLAAVED